MTDAITNITNSPTPLRVDANTPPDAPTAIAAPQIEVAAHPLPDDALIILPVRKVVLFPGVILPLMIGRVQSREAVAQAARLERPLGVLLQTKPDVEQPGPDDLHSIGTTASVLRYLTTTDGAHHAICQGIKRFRV